MDRPLPPVIFLMGPTASGKTEVAVDLVQRLPLEIVSVDSALVYRGMDIGTAKPGAELLRLAPHRLIDIRDPSEPYSAAEFRRDALAAMTDIRAQGRIVFVAAHTGYIPHVTVLAHGGPGNIRSTLVLKIRIGGGTALLSVGRKHEFSKRPLDVHIVCGSILLCYQVSSA